MTDERRSYPVLGAGTEKDPAYDRVAVALTDAELEDEILGKRGEAGYQAALLREADRRAESAPERPAAGRPALDADEWEEA